MNVTFVHKYVPTLKHSYETTRVEKQTGNDEDKQQMMKEQRNDQQDTETFHADWKNACLSLKSVRNLATHLPRKTYSYANAAVLATKPTASLRHKSASFAAAMLHRSRSTPVFVNLSVRYAQQHNKRDNNQRRQSRNDNSTKTERLANSLRSQHTLTCQSHRNSSLSAHLQH